MYILHLKVVHKAQLQLPHFDFSYNEHEGCVVLSCFAGSNERRDGGGLPVAVTFSTYYDRAAALKDEVSFCGGLNIPESIFESILYLSGPGNAWPRLPSCPGAP